MMIRISRYDKPGVVGQAGFDHLPDGTHTELRYFFGHDNGEWRGILYTRGGERTAVVVTHPRASNAFLYMIPFLLEGGCAVFVQESRYLNNDMTCIHEVLLVDIGQ